MRSRSSVPLLCCCLALCLASARAQSRSHAIAVNVTAECAVQIVGAPSGNQTTQTIAFRYRVRTGAARGQGRIVLQFPGSENYPAESKLDYQTELVGPGTPLSGSSPASNAASPGIVIARFGPQTSTSRAGGSGSVQLNLPLASSGLQQPVLSISCQ